MQGGCVDGGQSVRVQIDDMRVSQSVTRPAVSACVCVCRRDGRGRGAREGRSHATPAYLRVPPTGAGERRGAPNKPVHTHTRTAESKARQAPTDARTIALPVNTSTTNLHLFLCEFYSYYFVIVVLFILYINLNISFIQLRSIMNDDYIKRYVNNATYIKLKLHSYSIFDRYLFKL